jgi:hypothetical protein
MMFTFLNHKCVCNMQYDIIMYEVLTAYMIKYLKVKNVHLLAQLPVV